MSADLLRKAAREMREKAEDATPGPWVADRRMVVADPGPNAKYVADCFDEPVASDADAEHLASWHPAVALAVAGLLDGVASTSESVGLEPSPSVTAIARAYLGTDA